MLRAVRMDTIKMHSKVGNRHKNSSFKTDINKKY